MKSTKKIGKGIFLMLFMIVLGSCREHLIKVNTNPNGANPETTNPNLVLSTVLTEAGQAYVNIGFGDLMGTMQYTQKDGHSAAYNDYQWNDQYPWSGYYSILRNDRFVYEKAVETDNVFLEGVCLVMRAMMFGLLTDLYGDIPYQDALNGEKGGEENSFPAFSPQKEVYLGILNTLDTANTLLSKPANAYNANISEADVYYQGDPTKWRKLANSLALRYYMRLSEKLPQVAQAGIEKIVNNPDKYPVILSASDDALMGFPGKNASTSWPTNVKFNPDSNNYRVVKMGQTFVEKLLQLDDPRLGVWAQKVQVILKVDNNLPSNTNYITDTVIDGESRKVQYISPDQLTANNLSLDDINQNENYVGLPVALLVPYAYNMSPDITQASHNTHVSWLNPMYMQPEGPLLKARIMSAAEVHFILAEAKAVKGWTNVNAEQQYYAGIKASFEAWNVSGYEQYIQGSQVEYNGTQKQIMIQKWIANWSVAEEAWFDFRRTGYPDIHGVKDRTLVPELPVRYYYPEDARTTNKENEEAAAKNLQVTQYSAFGTYGKQNSIWSKMWVLQGTGEPW